jgi:hypothetical protein
VWERTNLVEALSARRVFDEDGKTMGFLRRHRWIIIAGGVAALVVAFLAFRPDKLFVDDVVDESLEDAFPVSAADPTPITATSSTVPQTTSPVGPATTAPPTTTTTTTEAPEASSPMAVAAGSFYGIDHSASGTATVYEQDGQYVLRFEDDTDIQNGPDLWVWVLPSDDYEGGDPAEFIDLGKIKGNVGGQNYELPEGFDPDAHRSVLIWCLRFGVPFAAAPLS